MDRRAGRSVSVPQDSLRHCGSCPGSGDVSKRREKNRMSIAIDTWTHRERAEATPWPLPSTFRGAGATRGAACSRGPWAVQPRHLRWSGMCYATATHSSDTPSLPGALPLRPRRALPGLDRAASWCVPQMGVVTSQPPALGPTPPKPTHTPTPPPPAKGFAPITQGRPARALSWRAPCRGGPPPSPRRARPRRP